MVSSASGESSLPVSLGKALPECPLGGGRATPSRIYQPASKDYEMASVNTVRVEHEDGYMVILVGVISEKSRRSAREARGALVEPDLHGFAGSQGSGFVELL